MHATASHRSAATPLAALNALLPVLEPGATTSSPGLTFAEQLGRHAAAGSVAPQLVDASLHARPDATADAPPADLLPGIGLAGDTPAGLRPQPPAPRLFEAGPAAASADLMGATRAWAPASDEADRSGMREFISQILPAGANTVPPDAAPLLDTAGPAEVATPLAAELCLGAVESSSPAPPVGLIPADSLAPPQAPTLPTPALPLAASSAGRAPAAARFDERSAVARPTPTPGQPARADLTPGRRSTEFAAMRKGESGAGVEKDPIRSADVTTPSPAPTAAPELAGPAADAAHEVLHDVSRDRLGEVAQGADGLVALPWAPGLETPLMPPTPAVAISSAPAYAAGAGPIRFERFERPAALPSRYSTAVPINRLPDATDERATLPDSLDAGHAVRRGEVRPNLHDALELGRTLDPTAQAPASQLEAPSVLHSPANPALEGAAPSATPPGAAALQPSATPLSNAPPLHVEFAVPLTSPQFRDAFALQVSVLARDGVQHAQVQLNPAEMGPISVQIALDGQQAQIHFGCDSAQTRNLVEAGLPSLAAALRDAGLTLSGGGVSQHTPGQRHDIDPGRGQRRAAVEPDAAAAAPVMRTIRIPTGRLDTYA